jgi:hypothetical protein
MFADPHGPQKVREVLADPQNFEFQVQSFADQHNFEFNADVGYRVTENAKNPSLTGAQHSLSDRSWLDSLKLLMERTLRIRALVTK